jgi:hypothetical protein
VVLTTNSDCFPKQHLTFGHSGKDQNIVWLTIQTKLKCPCGGGFEYLHRSHENLTTWQKRNSVSGGINGPPIFFGDINTVFLSSRLGDFRIWDSKIWKWVPRDSDSQNSCAAKGHQQLTVIEIWAQDGRLTERQTGRLTFGQNIRLTLTLSSRGIREAATSSREQMGWGNMSLYHCRLR